MRLQIYKKIGCFLCKILKFVNFVLKLGYDSIIFFINHNLTDLYGKTICNYITNIPTIA